MTSPLTIITAIASRQGTGEHLTDASASDTVLADLTTAVALVGGMGDSATVAATSHLLAEVIARTASRRGPLVGLLAASALVAQPSAVSGPVPDADAAVAVAAPGRPIAVAWVGTVRAYGWDGDFLRCYTSDDTRTTVRRAVVGSVREVEIPAREMLVMTTAGVHGPVSHGALEALVAEHQDDHQVLVNALVGAAVADEAGCRPDATAVVLRYPPLREGRRTAP